MNSTFTEKLTPSRCMWCVLNNLPKFDEKPEFILNLVEKWKELKDHDTLSSYLDLFLSVEKFYSRNLRKFYCFASFLKSDFKNPSGDLPEIL